jgi:hypothetical protein
MAQKYHLSRRLWQRKLHIYLIIVNVSVRELAMKFEKGLKSLNIATLLSNEVENFSVHYVPVI